MRITIRNSNKNVPTALIRKATKFYADRLLTPRQLKNLKLTIRVTDLSKTNDKGTTVWVDRPIKPRKLVIELANDFKTKETLLALAHEMVHVKQFVLGELRDQTLRANRKWKRYDIDDDKLDYFDSPQEVEAFGREYGLYTKFKKFNKGKSIGLYDPKKHYHLWN